MILSLGFSLALGLVLIDKAQRKAAYTLSSAPDRGYVATALSLLLV